MRTLFIISTILICSSYSNAQTVFSANYENQVDLKIYFVDYENQAGWKNLSKKQLMY